MMLTLIASAIVFVVLITAGGVARYLEWRAWDNDRRIARLRARR